MGEKTGHFDLIIVGGGASGLFTALLTAMKAQERKQAYRILILEKEKKLARKLLASGNGRCNLSNRRVTIDDYETSEPAILEQMLSCVPETFPAMFFKSLGIEIKEDEAGRLYPLSEEAAAVHASLLAALRAYHIEWELETEIVEIEQRHRGYRLKDEHGGCRTGKSVLFSPGSRASPRLGGNTSAGRLANRWSLDYFPERPALTALVLCDQRFSKQASGARFKGEARLRSGRTFSGEFLFSNLGLSGIVAMDISTILGQKAGYFQRLKGEEFFLFQEIEPILLNFVPALNKEKVYRFLLSKYELLKEKNPELLSASLIPGKIAQAIFNRRLKELKMKSYDELDDRAFRKELKRLSGLFCSYELSLSGLRSFDFAQIARGGIALSALRSDMSLHKRKGFFIAGESLDVAGRCGGYNLYFALASAYLAARGIVDYLWPLG